MQMWVLKPPGFDPSKKWPLAYLVHGGPQGAWEDGWSFRWNPEAWAAQGYVVALPNPRGSTGFGQKFVEEISGDWGGKCFDDLMPGVEYLEKLPYIDKNRMAAAGASFGGYMMNWFQGHTNKFKTLITHCGVYNFESMYATTEEIWFDEWEHGGPPWGRTARRTKSTRRTVSPRQFQDADAHHPQRPRLPRPGQRGAAAVHDAAAAGRAVAVHQLPRRRPLGAQAGQQRLLAPRGVRLAEEVRAAGRGKPVKRHVAFERCSCPGFAQKRGLTPYRRHKPVLEPPRVRGLSPFLCKASLSP